MARTKDSEVVGGRHFRGGEMVRTNEAIGSGVSMRENKRGGGGKKDTEEKEEMQCPCRKHHCRDRVLRAVGG
jgi:hypothetical protein